MFPAQTSLIPATVALVRWIEANGFGGLYPYWYLGSTPVKYLIGPAVPGILIGLHKILPNLSLFDVSYFILITSYFLSSVGWGILAGKLSGRRELGVIGGIGVLLMPWHWVSGLALSELSASIAGALTPWVLFSVARGPVSRFLPASARSGQKSIDRGVDQADLRAVGSPSTTATPREVYLERSERSYFSKWLPSLTFAGLLLTNAVAVIPTIIGLVILGIVLSKRWEDGLKRAGVVILAGWLIATLWYGPGYWLTIWGAPSLGGRTAIFALGWVIDMFRGLVPFLLAVGVVLVGIRPKDVYSKFAYSWFFVFAILTLIRFMADPDFWMDWTAWMGEVEVGVVLIAASKFAKIKHISNLSHLRNLSNSWNLLFGILILGGWLWAYQAKDFWLPRKSIENTVEFRIANWLSNNSAIQPASQAKRGEQSNNHSLVFLSGTTAFWLNSLADVRQVRGGADQGAVDKSWRDATWEIRQGATTEGTERVLKALKISYLVVHKDSSEEFYHDFVNPEIFDAISSLKKEYDAFGDVIYRYEN